MDIAVSIFAIGILILLIPLESLGRLLTLIFRLLLPERALYTACNRS